jgi:Ala-tRNA(Pro) deacylase
MPSKKLKQFLDDNKIEYITITHSEAYTAQQVAAYSHTPGKEMAKTVVVKLDDKLALAVLPASYQIDFKLLKKTSRAKKASLVPEDDFRNLFPDCEIGAMPPFGNLYDMDVYSTESLSEDEEIAFNAGTHTELIRMSYKDFERLVKPKTIRFSQRKREK